MYNKKHVVYKRFDFEKFSFRVKIHFNYYNFRLLYGDELKYTLTPNGFKEA